MVSGFGCQVSATEFDRCVGVADEMDSLLPVSAFSCNQISVQDSVFTDPPPAENHEQI
ncbi:hypothetical protein D1BOALGB6SA_3082 [Olavius sp. associated proteobacterium Delta 1]|nr:hypothetical protein D1BOALGB6SA_3082 [Olavius sp. associated proteobacterium Delta 1]